MRFMSLVKAGKNSGVGLHPSTEFVAVNKF